LLLEFTAATVALPESKKPPLTVLRPRSLNKRAKRVAALALETRDSNPEARHALRVALKRLRYALEFFAPLFPARRLQRYHQERCRPARSARPDERQLPSPNSLSSQAVPGHHSDLVRAWLAGATTSCLGNSPRCWATFSVTSAPWEHG
jgi:inorganic triphosphatase YgiF